MKNIFNSVQFRKPKSSFFDLTHDVKLSGQMGDLIPIMCEPVMPSDRFNISCEAMVRLAPLVAPIFHRLDCTMHYFFVPNRILWDGWEEFITNSAVKAFPTMEMAAGGTGEGTLADYLGIPPAIGAETEMVNAMPFAAYSAIYNEYYRDQNLVTETTWKLTDGIQANSDLYVIKRRAWEHDYFTAALPFAQKGDSVAIPVGQISEDVEVMVNSAIASPYTKLDGTPLDVDVNSSPSDDLPPASEVLYAPTGGLDVEPTTINDFRRAFKLQEWLEKNARGGTRYVESLLSHFFVQPQDARLQRPEYITGIKQPIQISEVLNTSATATEPQGNMSGHGISYVKGNYGRYHAKEHGYIIGIMSILPKTAYQQGLPKHFTKTTSHLDYPWPTFANIGEQEVLNKEVYAFQGAAGNNTFGYVPRYAEYKFANNRVAGEFRSSLDHWHMGRKFTAPPALNAAFVTSDPTTRIFAVEDVNADKIYCHVLNKVGVVRPLPKYGTPAI